VNERGFTLLELLVTLAMGAVILLALGKLYVSTVSWGRIDDRLAHMQRQGTLILDKMGRQIRGAQSIACSPLATCDSVATDPASACGVDPSLEVISPGGTNVCFRLNTAGGNDLVQASGGTQSSMRKESPAALTVSACAGLPMFSVINPTNPVGCGPCAPPNRVDICFQLNTTVAPTDSMIFKGSFTKRN
jgi:prepilin-type N-terminal cleavage/methylation domain-containing protein